MSSNQEYLGLEPLKWMMRSPRREVTKRNEGAGMGLMKKRCLLNGADPKKGRLSRGN